MIEASARPKGYRFRFPKLVISHAVYLPMDPLVESLNVSAVAAITLFQRVTRNV